ncbi:MAG: hypothetical protein AB1626_01985 [Candidatus Micrarchaeota archaeon]
MEKPSQKDVEKLMDDAVKAGAVRAVLYFDAQGTDKEALQNALVDLVGRLTKEKGVLYCAGEIAGAVEANEKGVYSSYGEVKILTKAFADLHNIALTYGPASVEILKPSEVKLNLDEAQAVLLDASQSSQDFVKYIMEKTLKPEEREKYMEQVKRRAELGKALREKQAQK